MLFFMCIHLFEAAVKFGDKLLDTGATDVKLTFSDVLEENQEAEKC